jgi:uncharacterized protein YndB with AHSA1/START domain
MADISVERIITATPEQVWALASDPTRYGDWSPENTGAKWRGDATGPAVGAKFTGTNRNGWARWRTTCTVTECVPNEVFTFESWALIDIARWSYRIDAIDATHTRVTEEWTSKEARPIERLASMLIRIDDRAEFNRAGMATTLAAMAAELEG